MRCRAILFLWPGTRSLEFAAASFVVQTFRNRLSAWSGPFSWFLLAQRVLNQVFQALQCVVPVFLLATKLLCLQDDDAVAVYALVMLLKQLVTNLVR